ncbi:MAG: zinc finger Ran-binding domain-containing protein [Thermoleophilia bacterium]|nr:zinc finger Ran-binding domain-containing protein [Thermoleophilia bacterium]MDH5280677.1 zinc finger Ran-binding domain-containing protein [Thermoleophilia bacterium]
MADAPWRCSECGTVNEPVANACRTCGRWPSLFDLEQSKVEDVELGPENGRIPEVVEIGEAESFEPEVFDVGQPDEPESEPESPPPRGWPTFGRLIVPLAVVIYLVITFIVNR